VTGVAKSVEKVKLIIKCSPETRRRFRAFKEIQGFKTFEEALNYLLDYYNRMSRMKIEAEVFGR